MPAPAMPRRRGPQVPSSRGSAGSTRFILVVALLLVAAVQYGRYTMHVLAVNNQVDAEEGIDVVTSMLAGGGDGDVVSIGEKVASSVGNMDGENACKFLFAYLNLGAHSPTVRFSALSHKRRFRKSRNPD